MSRFILSLGGALVVNCRSGFSEVFFGQYLGFLLEHPEIREHTPWSDRAVAAQADLWLELAGIRRPSRILDIGCGFGLHAIELAHRGHDVVGIELAGDVFLDKAKNLAEKTGVRVTWVEERFPCEAGERFDLILIINNYSMWNDAARTAARTRECLRPGAFLITGDTLNENFDVGWEGEGWRIERWGTLVEPATGRILKVRPHPSDPYDTYLEVHRERLTGALRQEGFTVSSRGALLVAKVLE
jgi:SAM-dependent methyltransferase